MWKKKSITLFFSSHGAVFNIGYLSTVRVCWLNMEKESSHIRMNISTQLVSVDLIGEK